MLMDDFSNAQDQRADDSRYMYPDYNQAKMTDSFGGGQKNQGDQSKMTSADEQLHQMLNDNNQWRFGLSEYEFEEFPKRGHTRLDRPVTSQLGLGIERLFEVKSIDCPILWIKIDPDFEFIRSVKIN